MFEGGGIRGINGVPRGGDDFRSGIFHRPIHASFESFQTQGKLRAAFAAVLKRPVAEVTCENLCQLVSQAATSSCHGVRWCTLI